MLDRVLSYRPVVSKLSMSEAPDAGLARWLYFSRKVIVRGVPPAWSSFSVLIGVGVVTVAVFIVSLSAVWIAVAALAAMLVVTALGSYRLWSDLDSRTPVALPAPAPPPAPTVDERLRLQLDRGYRTESDTFSGRVHDDYKTDPLYVWGLETWRVLRLADPVTAKAFYGESAPYEEGYFLIAFTMESDRGRHGYLQSRLRLLEQALARRS